MLYLRWVLILVVFIPSWACYDHHPPGDGDGDGDSDGDGDGDSDGDGDGDSDGDGDGDSDGDGDGDSDGDVHELVVFMGEGSVETMFYFYSSNHFESNPPDISVRFPGGQAQETWPEVELGDSITWGPLRFNTQECRNPTPLPTPGDGQCEEPWEPYCRATELGDANAQYSSCVYLEEMISPFLFARGSIAQEPLGIQGSYSRDESAPGFVHLEITNTHEEAVGPVILIYRNLMGECGPGGCVIDHAEIATRWIDSIPSNGTEADSFVPVEVVAEPGQSVEAPDWLLEQEDSIASMLTGGGWERALTNEQADAALNVWRHTFFSLEPNNSRASVPLGESVAVVYRIPSEVVDEALPVTISSPPRMHIRVGLGYKYLLLE